MKVATKEIRLQGIPISRGIAIGKPLFFHTLEEYFEDNHDLKNNIPDFAIEKEGVAHEINRYRQAIACARDDIKRLQKKLEGEQILEGAAILDAQLQMMLDPLLTQEVEQEISSKKRNAESVFQEVIKIYQNKFNSIFDPFFRERFKDIQDISRRVMRYLLKSVRVSAADSPSGSIVFSQELTTSDIVESNKESIEAFVSHLGGATSHAAIVAKAKGIPYVTSIDLRAIEPYKDSQVIVDGRTGEIIINPTPETLKTYKSLRAQLRLQLNNLKKMEGLPAKTYDGYLMKLSANIESCHEVDVLHRYQGSGVGLFRSEQAFLSNSVFPLEEEQFQLYRNIVQKMNGLPIVIRTFDVGGDKLLGSHLIAEESNPYLGCRAIRFSLKEREIFKAQLSAILRASAFGDVSIMFPMVSGLPELLEAKEIIKEVRANLKERGIAFADHIPIGCMIEVPSAAIISDLLAKECDFLSIGTNDLTQYTLAVDRGNHFLSNLYAPTHPSVIRLIKLIVHEANQHGIPVAICGEIASDPRFTPLLLGLGVRELSVAARHLPVVKNAIRNTSIVDASRLALKVLSLSTASEVQELLEQEYRRNVPDDVFYNV